MLISFARSSVEFCSKYKVLRTYFHFNERNNKNFSKQLEVLCIGLSLKRDVYEVMIFFLFCSSPDTDEECLKFAVSLVKIVYWLLIVVTRLLKLSIEVSGSTSHKKVTTNKK